MSDKNVPVGLNCIETPTLWNGDISEAPNIDIAINDDGPSRLTEYLQFITIGTHSVAASLFTLLKILA